VPYERWELVDQFGWAAVALVPGWLLLVGLPLSARRVIELSAPGMGFLRRGLAAAFARGPYQRPPDDYPGERDYGGGTGIL
jgi:hypothetical protein